MAVERAWDAHAALREWMAEREDEEDAEGTNVDPRREPGPAEVMGELEWLEDELFDELIEAMEGDAWGRRGPGRTEH